ncbi:MAG: hypothetical protein ACUVUR_01945 [bacterium]
MARDLTIESNRADVYLASDTIHLIWNCGYRRSTDGGTSWDSINIGVSGQALAASNNLAAGFFGDTAMLSGNKLLRAPSVYYIRRNGGQSGSVAEPVVQSKSALTINPNPIRVGCLFVSSCPIMHCLTSSFIIKV